MGVNVPIVPGVMPIGVFHGRASRRLRCGNPAGFAARWEGFGDDTASIRAFGLDVVTDLCPLLEDGAPGLHFYTLNQAGFQQRFASAWVCRANRRKCWRGVLSENAQTPLWCGSLLFVCWLSQWKG